MVIDNLIEWFALDLRFRIEIPEDNTYTFYINSDDGSKLYINNQLLIDNDGQHGQVELSGAIALTAGVHDVKVEYFQGPRFAIALELFGSLTITKNYVDQQRILPNLTPISVLSNKL